MKPEYLEMYTAAVKKLWATTPATCSDLRESADRAAREILETWDVSRYETHKEGPIGGYPGRFVDARPSQLAEIIGKHFAPNPANTAQNPDPRESPVGLMRSSALHAPAPRVGWVRWFWRVVGSAWIWLRYSKGTQQAALNAAHRLLADAWAAGRKQRLQDHTDNLALSHEVRMFACDIANERHLKAAIDLPRVIFQLGRFAVTVSRPGVQRDP